jgi:2-dehydro-3-deoxyphosphogluconate aldolase/(4S)-4-hydroxy-2-oxoglutarate aldolase
VENKIMKKDAAISLIFETGVIAIMRAESSKQLLAAADAIRSGGVRVIEVTMTTPGALSVIQAARESYDEEVLFGAGSVLDAETARAAILSGAQFIVSPILDGAIIALCRRYSIPVIPGAYTPTEALLAWQAGADLVKIFPASVGGPGYLKAIKAPLPQLRLCPVGGVNLETAADFIRKGADCIAVGSALINQKLLEEGDLDALTERAQQFLQEVAKGRSKV